MIKDTLYAKYIEEREGSRILEESSGFIIYKINQEECFIVDMHIEKEARGSGLCRSIIDRLKALAKLEDCKFISANIHLSDKGAQHTLMAALFVGFKVVRAEQNILSIVLDFKGGV